MPESQFDPALSADLHNKILEYAWTAAGNDLSTLSSTSWWQTSAPVEIDSRLIPNLVSFLRLAKVVSAPVIGSGLCFFYFLHSLQEQTRFFIPQPSKHGVIVLFGYIRLPGRSMLKKLVSCS